MPTGMSSPSFTSAASSGPYGASQADLQAEPARIALCVVLLFLVPPSGLAQTDLLNA
jgi:hypothetical protein